MVWSAGPWAQALQADAGLLTISLSLVALVFILFAFCPDDRAYALTVDCVVGYTLCRKLHRMCIVRYLPLQCHPTHQKPYIHITHCNYTQLQWSSIPKAMALFLLFTDPMRGLFGSS